MLHSLMDVNAETLVFRMEYCDIPKKANGIRKMSKVAPVRSTTVVSNNQVTCTLEGVKREVVINSDRVIRNSAERRRTKDASYTCWAI